MSRPSQLELDELFMARALELAERGLFSTPPNPRVGCVLVNAGEVIGEGWHERAGGPHAEVAALANCRTDPAGCTVYVTLEPCAHHGRTPPCVETLLKARPSRVVIASVDADPRTGGKSVEQLRAAGIDVHVGVAEAAALSLNPGFFRRMRSGLPWVRVKLAMSLDGRTAMASGESRWITGEPARRDVQQWRARSCAVVTGAGTVLSDDPQLTVRELPDAPPYRQPLRVVLDRRGRAPSGARVFDDSAPTLWIRAHPAAASTRVHAWYDGALDGGGIAALLTELARRECNEVLVEAGATLAGAFLDQGLWDELIIYIAPKLMGASARPLVDMSIERMREALPLRLLDVTQFDGDVRIRYVKV